MTKVCRRGYIVLSPLTPRLEGANLRGVDLSRTKGLTRVQLEAAIIDERTVLPVVDDEGRGAVSEEADPTEPQPGSGGPSV